MVTGYHFICHQQTDRISISAKGALDILCKMQKYVFAAYFIMKNHPENLIFSLGI